MATQEPSLYKGLADAAKRGRGAAIYTVAPTVRDRLLTQLGADLPELEVVDLEQAELTGRPPARPHLFINACMETLAGRTPAFYRRLLELTRYHCAPVYFLSSSPEASYFADSVWDAGSNDIDDGRLFGELVPEVLSSAGFVFPDAGVISSNEISAPPLTPIERAFHKALAESGLSFRAQHRVGPYTVDFMIDESGRRQV